MYIYDNKAIETARESAQQAMKELRKAIEKGQDIKEAIVRWREANQSYLTMLRLRHNL